ncbi:MAG: hypothetical protein WCK29_03375 [archaeon]
MATALKILHSLEGQVDKNTGLLEERGDTRQIYCVESIGPSVIFSNFGGLKC